MADRLVALARAASRFSAPSWRLHGASELDRAPSTPDSSEGTDGGGGVWNANCFSRTSRSNVIARIQRASEMHPGVWGWPSRWAGPRLVTPVISWSVARKCAGAGGVSAGTDGARAPAE